MRTRVSPRYLLWMGLAATLLMWPADALAQQRSPGGRGGGGGGGGRGGAPSTGVAVPRSPGHVSHPIYTRPYYRPYYGYGYPYYAPYFYSSFYWGWGGFGWYPYWGYPYPYYPYYGGGYVPWYDDLGALRIEIKPREAQVYVDGYFVGVIDSFDGAFQKLGIDAGGHRIQIKAPGYETISFEVLITPNETVTYKGELPRVQ